MSDKGQTWEELRKLDPLKYVTMFPGSTSYQERAAAAESLKQLRTIVQYGVCGDCGYPLEKTEAGDVVCHKCSDQIGDTLIEQLKQKFSQIHALLAHGRTVGGNRQQAYSDAEDIANRVVHPEQYQTCNWDNISSPDFDGCNGCPRTCATE